MSCRFKTGSFLFAEGLAYMTIESVAISFWRKFGFFRSVFYSERKKVLAVLQVYQELGQSIEEFQEQTTLRCVVGCGRCCENPQVESTVLELLPLAQHLWQNGEAESWLKKAKEPQNLKQCLFYEPHSQGQGRGHCGVYKLRPLVCRLFGFSAKTDKYNNPLLVTCQTIKETQKDAYSKTVRRLEEGLPVPRMSDYTNRISFIDPSLAQKKFPINEALRMALERVGFQSSYKEGGYILFSDSGGRTGGGKGLAMAKSETFHPNAE
jgi:Fe-S-cluster containining protein